MDASSSPSPVPSSSSSNAKHDPKGGQKRHDKVSVWRRQDLSGLGRLWCYFWDWLILNTWVAEVFAMLLSIASTIAIIIVLRIYDGKGTPHLPYGITLNAVISVLATASKTSLLYLVASALSQLKWCWFQKDRRLQDMQSFDDASRGPWGSLVLLFELRWKSLASVGAFVTVLALAFDPFVQQVVRYPSRDRAELAESASVKRSNGFKGWESFAKFTEAVNMGIYSRPDFLRMAPPCPSGNCEWHEFSSFEWCSKCADMTSSASATCLTSGNISQTHTCRLSLDQNLHTTQTIDTGDWLRETASDSTTWSAKLQYAWTLYNLSSFSPDSPSKSELPLVAVQFPQATYLGIRSPLLAMGHIAWTASGSVNGTEAWIRSAEQCVLTPCLTNYKISVRDGSANINVVDRLYGSLRQYVWFPQDGWSLPFICWDANGARPDYDDLYTTLGNINNEVAGLFCAQESKMAGPINVGLITYPLNGYAIHELFKNNSGDSTTTSGQAIGMRLVDHDLSYILESVAESLSHESRASSNHTVAGSVTTKQTFVHVRWAWLILPFVLEVAGLVALITAILSSRYHKARLWKGSLLPLLYHGLEEKERSVATDVQSMEEVARRDIVSLDQSSADRIVLQSGSAR